jgi:hypothetical protein
VSESFASVSCSIEVYPFEQGPYSIQGGQIRSCTVSKSIKGNSPGTFMVELAPGGPLGVEDPNTWSKIVTPMSHVIIGMSRGSAQNIVMDGVSTDAGESQLWISGERESSAGRNQAIVGKDFSWFFDTFSFYALTFYGLTAGTPVGGALNILPGNLLSLINQGLVGGNNSEQSNPVQVGRIWYQKVMSGPNGILSGTKLPYEPIGTYVTFNAALAATWESYPDVFIPYADNFMVTEESWGDKFRSIFNAPWYEFFVTTAPASAYQLVSGGIQDPGTQFSISSMPAAVAAGPRMVARINPFPKFSAVPSGSNAGVDPGSLDMSRWNALPIYDFTNVGFGFTSSSVGFSAAGACNFYQLNPTSYTLYGLNNANNIPSIFNFIAACDPASVQRYGFRPFIGTTRWMFDANGGAAQNSGLDIQNTILQLTANYVSWIHPEPLMAKGDVVIPLNPSILAGTRFRYAPFKDGEPWDFYVEGFKHVFVFGGESRTTLTLTRGLPSSVYADASDGGVLRAILMGNAMRQNGEYVVGLPPGSALPLTFVVTSDQAAQLSQKLTAAYVTPQTK